MAGRSDFPITRAQSTRRVRQGICLADMLQAFRIGQLKLWERVQDAARDDPRAQQAALSIVGQIMHLYETCSALGAEAYLEAERQQFAESDRLRRDLLEDLLARNHISPGPKQALLRAAGLEPEKRMVVVLAELVDVLPPGRTPTDAVAAVRRGDTGAPGLTVVRQDEIVGIAAVPFGGAGAILRQLEHAVDDLAHQQVRLAVGVSTVHSTLREVPEAYHEARTARLGLGNRPGVVALPRLSVFEYLMLRDDDTARRLIRPAHRHFIQDDAGKGGALVQTLVEYAASDLNATIAAKRLHMHVNTMYYRLERIAERTGCDLRRFADVQELLIAVHLMGAARAPSS